jgi:hypothetical protein
MPRVVEEPVTKDSNSSVSDSVTTHPAYAQIRASRVSGSTSLYDSDFRHQHYMTITISRSELHRGLNRDMHFSNEDLIEIALSEAQWATFVSSPNVGMGVPCTLERLDGKPIPGLPDPQSRVDQFSEEVRVDLEQTIGLMDKALKELQGVGLSKTKYNLVAEAINSARRNLNSNLPFVADQFSEHMENVFEAAKQEIHGYMTNVIQRAGMSALKNGDLPLQIEQGKNTDTRDADVP